MNYVTLTQQDNNLIVFLSSGAKGLEACSLRTPGAKSNWVDKSGGLPTYICNIAKEIKKTGKSESEAIAIAVSRAKVWAAGGAKVSDATKAKAAAAVAAWEALKAKADSKSLVKASREDGSEYIMELAGTATSFNVDQVRTAWQSRQNQLRQEANANYPDGPYQSYPYSYIRELWTDHVIVEIDDKDGQSLASIPYTVDADNNEVDFGDPQAVKVEYVPVSDPATDLDADDLSLLNDILKMSATQLAYQRIVGLSHSLKE